MSDIVFKDCEYRYVEDGTLCCKNKQGIEMDLSCDNCTGNIHLNCDNYNAKGVSQLIERDDYDRIVDLLNELAEENEQLKKRCNEYWEEAGLNGDYF